MQWTGRLLGLSGRLQERLELSPLVAPMKLLVCAILLTALPVFAAETGCVDDCATGIGTYYFANGDRYEGEWKDGNKDGLGTFYFADGDRAKEEWIEGERNRSRS